MASGWIILDKDSGLFSRTAGAHVAKLFGEKTAGHIGTLDPMASGVLAIAIGKATKMIPFVEDFAPDVKEYLFSVQFGAETDSLDITGKEIKCNGIIPEEKTIRDSLAGFVGKIKQVPPVYSAVHVKGRRAYELARAGQNPEINPRIVRIDELELISGAGKNWTFRVRCGRGTYVRALARDIAKACGTIATVDMIKRTVSGGFQIKNAVKLDFLKNMVNNSATCQDFLMPVDFGLGDIPVQNLDDKSAVLYKNGGFVKVGGADGLKRVFFGDVLIGIGRVVNGLLQPKRTI